MAPSTRPSKHARFSPEASSSLHASPSAASLTDLNHHPELWFDDGNVVLIAQQMGFRIFRGLLTAQSTVFADMFSSASSADDETLDGCPVVHLSDSHLDLAHLLRILLPTAPLCYPTTSSEAARSFDEVFAVVRLAHKYHIQAVQDQAIRALQESHFMHDFNAYTSSSKQQIAIKGPQFIGAVNLARLTDTPSMLPLALLGCSFLGGALLDGWTREDGTTEHLSAADVKRCVDARIALAQEQCLLLSRVFQYPVPAGRCVAQGCCAESLANIARCALSKERLRLSILHDWTSAIRVLTSQCEGCQQALLERNRVERQRVWNELPRVFGVAVEGWVKADAVATDAA